MIQCAGGFERRRQVDDHATCIAAGGAIVVAFAHAIQQRFTGQFRGNEAGQSANCTKFACAGITGARAPLVAIGIGHNTNPVAQPDCILQQPLKRAPG